ncbi:MAG: hypothetical protein MUP47_07130 [Phycisphaerae bacterium]|nr:hypothetical protein [Phycisphaerae bacterium]
MRRQMWTILSGVVVSLLAVQVVLAQEAPPPPGPGGEGPATREGRGMRGLAAPRMVDELIKEMGLTEEAGAKVRALFDEFREGTRTWQRENGSKLRDLYEQFRDARESSDEPAVKELTGQVRKLHQERLALREKLLTQLKEILTAEQLEKVKDVVIEWRAMLRRITRDMTLSDQQKAKLDQIIKEWREDTDEALVPERWGTNFRALIEKVVTEVILTDAQRQVLAAMQGEEKFFEKVMKLDLTEAQKQQVDRFRVGPERRRRSRGGEGPETRPASGPQPPAGPPGGEGPGGGASD